MKRTIDIMLAVFGLIVGLPLIAVVAMAVRLDSPGRVIFSQTRLGKNGRRFRMHKFRKFPDSWDGSGPGVTVAGDARMTRLGRFLERSKLDELPQLWNILRGEMSFVGPRPESERYADLFSGDYARVLDFVPGIFGPNQVAFRNESEMYPPERDPDAFYREELFPQKARADIAYFTQSSFLSDLGWIARGLWYSFAGAVNWKRILDLHGRVVILDAVAIETAWLAANLVRFGGPPPDYHLSVYITGTWLLPVVLLVIMMLGGCYRAPVRYFCAGDALRLVIANIVGWTMAYLILLGIADRNASIYLAPLGFILTLSMMGFPRVWSRETWRRQVRNNGHIRRIALAIYGAGSRGAALASLFDYGFPDTDVVGFLDDNDAKMRGRVVLGHTVLGSERDLETIHAVHNIDQVWITFEPDIYKYRRLKNWCEQNGVKLVVLPVTDPFVTLCYPENSATPRPASNIAIGKALKET